MKPLLVLSLLLCVVPAFASSVDGSAPKGQYALEKADCGTEVFAKFSPKSLDFLTYSCKNPIYDQVVNSAGKITYTVSSKACIGEEDTKAKPDKFKIVFEAETMRVFWSDGTKSGKAVLCKQ